MEKFDQRWLEPRRFNLSEKRRSVPFKTSLFVKIRLVDEIERINMNENHTSVLDTCH